MYRVASGLGALKVSRPHLEPYPALTSLAPSISGRSGRDSPIRSGVACGRVARRRILLVGDLSVVRTRAGLICEPGS